MLELTTEIDIHASPARVWQVLTDFSAHPEWNPFVRRISGMPKTGERLTVFIQPAGGKGMRFRPRVLVADPERELRWLGRFLLPGIFDGEHYFRIHATAPGKVRFEHGEKFSGMLVGLAKSQLESGTRAGFDAMNRALKARAEGAHSSQPGTGEAT